MHSYWEYLPFPRTAVSVRYSHTSDSESESYEQDNGKGMIKAQYTPKGRKHPMANVIKKHSISFELAQKMVDAAVAKAREIGVSENVAILDDGGNLKAFSRMDGAPIPTIEMAQNKAYTALFGISTQDFFNFIKGDPSLLAGIPTLARMAAWGGGF